MVKQIIIYTQGLKSAETYTIDKKINKKDLNKIGERLINPVTQKFEINQNRIPNKVSNFIEIGFLPGVTDNAGTTAQEFIEDLLKIKFENGEKVYTSKIILGKFNQPEKLINPLIQRQAVNQRLAIPRVKLNIKTKSSTKPKLLALDDRELKVIDNYFKKKKRRPSRIELESLAQTWSEHCQHKIFKSYFEEYIKKATTKINKKICVSVFKDNSGAIEFDKDHLVTYKVETHNSPSALDPFGGAITGIVGVNRDTIGFGLGAKPVINCFGFCLADPVKDKARWIFDGVVKGVNSGGNCSGIPTPQGFLYFDQSYQAKPLVFVGTVGIMPKKQGKRRLDQKQAKVGDYVVMIGGRVGADGIHGATFSSEPLSPDSPAGAVQIGDPITQKKLSDALVKEARDLNLYNSITDNGAGGLSCSVSEMAKESGGFEVDLETVPLKYPGLQAWQIWVSESQERMTLAVPKNKWLRLKNLMEKRGVEATKIGRFTNSGKAVVKYKTKKIMDLSMEFLHNGWPKKQLTFVYKKKTFTEPLRLKTSNLTQELSHLLASLNLCSFEFISRQFDHEVQGGSIIKPLQGLGKVNGETSITRPLLNSKKGVVLAQGLFPQYGLIDPYWMTANSLDMAVKNAVIVGADLNKIVLLDNFCWCSSNEPERLGQLKQAAQACYDFALSYKTPYISGKDSMFNDWQGLDKNKKPIKLSILPTVLISALGIINDVSKAVSMEVKFPGDLVYVLGETKAELGGSEYFKMLGYVGNQVPQVDGIKNNRLYQALAKAIKANLIVSGIGVSRGGLGLALVKSAMAGQLGLQLDLRNIPGNCQQKTEILFSESSGRIVVTINPKNQSNFEKLMGENTFSLIGKVSKEPVIRINNWINLPVKTALLIYKSRFKKF